ncbi:MATE family efflux transporter [Flammeovirga sp. SubArs3]|uniref:MATE family efflux transporter n=1 Tax=Flammeovirga sp. SubArs3 TaxID=2995316 RepID=UPI00248C2742|nr:MATE family efflux transporter [Flammeovirga sp. SubArs3]
MNAILNGKVSNTLTKMSLPISVGMLSTFLFQVIDTYFVGQLGGNALAALSFSSVLYFMIVGLFMGLAIGVSTLVGKLIGEQKNKIAEHTIILGLVICLLSTTVLSVLVFLFSDQLFSLLGATPEILPLVQQYLNTLLVGLPLLTTGIMAGSLLRANGNLTKPEVIMAIAGVINLVLDYGFIFGHLNLPELGIQGAALATVISWVFIIVGMTVLFIQDKLIKLNYSITSISVKTLTKDIFSISIPITISNIISPFTQMFITYVLATHSAMAVAAFGVAGRVEMLSLIGIMGVSTAITPFIAQNLGAKNTERIDKAIVFGGKAAFYLGLIVFMILFSSIGNIAQLFSEDLSVVNYSIDYFNFISLSYIFYGMFLVTTAILNGLQNPGKSMKIMLIKTFVFTFPLAIIGSYFYGTTGVFVAIGLSNILGGIYAMYIMRQVIKSLNTDLKDKSIINDYKNDFVSIIRH